MKTILLVLSLLLSVVCYAPYSTDKTINFETESDRQEKILNNLVYLKDDKVKTRKEIYQLIQPVIQVYLERKNSQAMFELGDSLSHALACIFVSESSNALGQPAKSSLWILHSNPFGLTSTSGVTKTSWEEIKGKRVVMNRTFKSFNNFEEALDSLLFDYLYKSRFEKLWNSKSVKEFLYTLYACGYMTDSNWPNFAYNEIYLKCKI